MRDQRQQTAMVMVPMLGDQPRLSAACRAAGAALPNLLENRCAIAQVTAIGATASRFAGMSPDGRWTQTLFDP